MDSKIPKPSSMLAKKPISNKPERFLFNKFDNRPKLPLTGIANLPNFLTTQNRKRAVSPDLAGPNPNMINRAKLRRSKSASDLRQNMPQKSTFKPTLPTIPAKSMKLAVASVAVSSKLATTTLSNKSKTNFSGIAKAPIKVEAKPAAPAKTMAKRIPPYDYKARFADLQEKHKTLKEKYEIAREQISLMDTLPELYEASTQQIKQLNADFSAARTEVVKLTEQTKTLTTKNTALTSSLMETKAELGRQTVMNKHLVTENTHMKMEGATIKAKLEGLEKQVDSITEDNEHFKEEIFRANIERKELHNQVMDLKGNIRVFCRVRRPIASEEERTLATLAYIDEQTLEMCNLDATNKKIRHEFSFDQVFHSHTQQEDIFDMVAPLIQSALDGYNICIFAYGQTGSGKTYTMDGVVGAMGVIPRTVNLIFKAVSEYKRLGWEYECRASFLEIYNEVLYDLLSNENKEMDIRMVNAKSKTDIYVSNLTQEAVTSIEYLNQLIDIAKNNRATAATINNDRSSRSHAVTQILLKGYHKEKNETCIGTINLVDLAGSESPKTSVRMEETKNINRSLSELSNVILALVQKQDHIPYRNSKLTHLLMPSLGGNSKTLMFVNVAPFQDCFVESVKSLRFASTVNSCKLAKAKRNKFLNTSANSSAP